VVIYEMLTGELPLGRFAPPSRKVQIDVRLDDVVLRALEKEPERRYQQATEMKTDVEAVAAQPGRVVPVDDVAADLRLPAIGLLIVGVLDLALLVFVFGMTASINTAMGPQEALIVGGGGVFGLPIILGAIYMLKLARYDFVRLAAALALVPCTVVFFLSLPFGLWSLIILHRPDVRAAFRERQRGRRSSPEKHHSRNNCRISESAAGRSATRTGR
jgi:hypothetical protein